MKPFTRRSKTATSFPVFQNLSIKENPNKKPSKYYTFADFFEWYNDLDVTPMIQAFENMNDFYKQKHINFMH